MGIPAIVGLGDEFLSSTTDGELLLVNGYTGEVISSPTGEQIKQCGGLLADDISKKELLKNLKGKETVTRDGTRVSLYANIGGTRDIAEALFCDAEGIGLFRSEFLYLNRDDFPSEDEQFASYKKVLESMGEKRVIIRTLDIGADKQASYFDIPREENPALGFRAIRICLARPELFKTQLRALYRASVFGNLGIMFPMITSVHEVERALDICDEVKHELDTKGIAYSKSVEIGIMIETPASAIISDSLAPLVDFFSVGTNDLTQYTLACDRQNGALDDFCDTHHEAILRLIEFSAKSAHENGAWIGICGELASDISLTERFLRMGVDELSVSPSYILKVRDAIRKIDLSK
jgi:phosphotransferase system enzyme I (PtsI)